MASSLSRKLGGAIFSSPRAKLSAFHFFCTKSLISEQSESDGEIAHPSSSKQRPNADRPLENGLDVGIYKVHITQAYAIMYKNVNVWGLVS